GQSPQSTTTPARSGDGTAVRTRSARRTRSPSTSRRSRTTRSRSATATRSRRSGSPFRARGRSCSTSSPRTGRRRSSRQGLKKDDGSRVVGDVRADDPPQRASVEALGELYRRSYHRYLRVAEAVVGDVELAHDAVQDAFARAIRGRFADRGEGSLEGWVWR